MFKIQTLKDEKTTSQPEKEKDIYTFEKKGYIISNKRY